MLHSFLSKLISFAPQALAVPNKYITLWQLRAAGLSGAEPLTEAVHSARQNGKPVKLSSYQGLFGKPVVLVFYPADGTPGCTKQAQSLKDSFGEFKKVLHGFSK